MRGGSGATVCSMGQCGGARRSVWRGSTLPLPIWSWETTLSMVLLYTTTHDIHKGLPFWGEGGGKGPELNPGPCSKISAHVLYALPSKPPGGPPSFLHQPTTVKSVRLHCTVHNPISFFPRSPDGPCSPGEQFRCDTGPFCPRQLGQCPAGLEQARTSGAGQTHPGPATVYQEVGNGVCLKSVCPSFRSGL